MTKIAIITTYTKGIGEHDVFVVKSTGEIVEFGWIVSAFEVKNILKQWDNSIRVVKTYLVSNSSFQETVKEAVAFLKQ